LPETGMTPPTVPKILAFGKSFCSQSKVTSKMEDPSLLGIKKPAPKFVVLERTFGKLQI
jgi:hypothetical protein